MLYIISFQSISCREASPTSPRPHKGPPEGVSERGFGPGLPIGHPLNLPPGFQHVAQLCPLAGSSPQSSARFPSRCSTRSSGRSSPQSSTRFPTRCSARPSGRSLKTILKPAQGAVFNWAFGAGHNPVFSDGVSPDLPCSPSACPSPRPPYPQVLQCHPHVPSNPTISLKPASNRTSTSPRHGHPTHRSLSAIPTCRTIQQSLSNRPLNGPRPVLATTTLPTSTSGAFPRGKAVIYHPFATATLPTGTPVPSPRAEQSHNLSQTGI